MRVEEISDDLTEVERQSTLVYFFRRKTQECFHLIDGHNVVEIESMVRQFCVSKLKEYELDVQVKNVILSGSRCRGIENETSDVDIVLEYIGDEKEDFIFNILNENEIFVGGKKIDINPITENQSGLLCDYLKRAEEYLKRKEEMQSENRNQISNRPRHHRR